MQLEFLGVPTDASLQLAFALPDERDPRDPAEKLVIGGRVAWRKMSATGVCFDRLAPMELARLRTFLESRVQA
jgi:hypothetical protein